MTVQVQPIPEHIPLPPGFRAAGLHCGLKKHGLPDLGLLVADRPVRAAAIFTRNLLVGAHIHVCREHLDRSGGLARAILVNARNANCATGEQGIADARACCQELAHRLRCPAEQILMASTGPIGAPLPTERIVAHLDALLAQASANGGMDFARAIMTTDSWPKAVHHKPGGAAVTGFAKGSGMIHPDMATMLGFLLTDGAVEDSAAALELLRSAADRSFHRVTVDGDTSPNDSLFLLASGNTRGPGLGIALTTASQQLARAIAADGEGATRLCTIQVRGAASEAEAAHVGRVIGTSPLVKTAVAGRDPNWGRILSAAGRAGVAFAPAKARVWIGAADLYSDGQPHPEHEPLAHQHLAREECIVLGIDLARGEAAADVWTCDLTKDYVQINADYRS